MDYKAKIFYLGLLLGRAGEAKIELSITLTVVRSNHRHRRGHPLVFPEQPAWDLAGLELGLFGACA